MTHRSSLVRGRAVSDLQTSMKSRRRKKSTPSSQALRDVFPRVTKLKPTPGANNLLPSFERLPIRSNKVNGGHWSRTRCPLELTVRGEANQSSQALVAARGARRAWDKSDSPRLASSCPLTLSTWVLSMAAANVANCGWPRIGAPGTRSRPPIFGQRSHGPTPTAARPGLPLNWTVAPAAGHPRSPSPVFCPAP